MIVGHHAPVFDRFHFFNRMNYYTSSNSCPVKLFARAPAGLNVNDCSCEKLNNFCSLQARHGNPNGKLCATHIFDTAGD